jgi:serine/threonine-protein kinase
MPLADVHNQFIWLEAAVHGEHMLHHDCSPDNIVIPGGRTEQAMIIDFGEARSVRLGGSFLICVHFNGMYNYVSSERLALFGSKANERSNIYRLGLVPTAVLHGRVLDMTGRNERQHSCGTAVSPPIPSFRP